jgi:hypothetical protein
MAATWSADGSDAKKPGQGRDRQHTGRETGVGVDQQQGMARMQQVGRRLAKDGALLPEVGGPLLVQRLRRHHRDEARGQREVPVSTDEANESVNPSASRRLRPTSVAPSRVPRSGRSVARVPCRRVPLMCAPTKAGPHPEQPAAEAPAWLAAREGSALTSYATTMLQRSRRHICSGSRFHGRTKGHTHIRTRAITAIGVRRCDRRAAQVGVEAALL